MTNKATTPTRDVTSSLPAGSISRLTEHYGRPVEPWLEGIERELIKAAEAWHVSLEGYYDAGWTSVIAAGATSDSQAVIIKALPESDRYRRERDALQHWRHGPAVELLQANDAAQMLLLDSVAGAVGGATRPKDHPQRTAATLPQLHKSHLITGNEVPRLSDYYLSTVLPRIARRAQDFPSAFSGDVIHLVHNIALKLCGRRRGPEAMLHSDLYAENVLFDSSGRAVFIDPHAKVGPPAFDWAFWCVYYESVAGFDQRAAICRQHVPELYEEILKWSLTLVVDGGLFYLDTGDERATEMRALIGSTELVSTLTGHGAAG